MENRQLARWTAFFFLFFLSVNYADVYVAFYAVYSTANLLFPLRTHVDMRLGNSGKKVIPRW